MPSFAVRPARHPLALALMVASGFAALGYQIVWTQQSTLWLGHEAPAVLAVVAAFFGGLAVGALALGPRIDRSAHPARWYAACEASIAVWSLALALLLAPLSVWLLRLIGPQPAPLWHWMVTFSSTFILLLPATAAMGATLPAMERVLVRLRSGGAPIATLYAGNTCGAVLGVLVVAFALVPRYGLMAAASVCALLNLLCAGLAFKLLAAEAEAEVAKPAASSELLWLLAATGLLGIGYEVLVVRVLSQVAENTVYTFALLLAVYLVGTACGAAAYDRWWVNSAAARLRDQLLRTLAATCVGGMFVLAGAKTLKAWLLEVLGPGMGAALTAEAALAAAAFLLPTILMGALFSHLGTSARAAGISFGRALGINTLGAALAPLLFGVLLVPALGPRLALLLVAAGYLALCSQRTWWRAPQWTAAAAMLLLVLWAPAPAGVDIPTGGRLVSHAEGVMAAVSVVEDANGVATLHIDNRQQEGSSATLLADTRQGLLPILLHPSPRRALFLGLGTGVTASAAAADPQLRVDVVELLPEVIEASERFRAPASSAPLHVLRGDARRFVRASTERYDVIVADNFHPARSGSGTLYTVEHFGAVRERLAPGGLFCQWLPLHQLDLVTLRSIVGSFLTAYPQGWALLATNSLDTPVIGLVAMRERADFDEAALRSRLTQVPLPYSPAEFGIGDELALLGTFIGGPRSLAHFAATAALNTDDHPVVVYSAPRITYAPDSLPRERLLSLLQELSIESGELLGTTGSDRRLDAYWAARDRFLEAGRDVEATADVRRMLAQVREPLLSVLRLSPDFRPAYDPLLRMAMALSQVDVVAARALLLEMIEAQPARPEAAQLLRELPALP